MTPAAATAARAAAVGAGLLLWFWTQRLLAGRRPEGPGIGDAVHRWTAPLHDWLGRRPRAADALLVATSAGIDLLGLWLLAAAIFGRTLRPFLALVALYALRQACQGLCALPAPPGVIWRRPWFPSLLVTYGTAHDYFFSGHTAIAVLGAIALADAGGPGLAAAGVALAAVEAATVLVLRAHYTMDVIAAALAAWCSWALAGVLAPGVDAWLAGR